MILSAIAALGQNREIGFQNQLLWHIAADMKWFRQHTSGHTVIMGRLTFESINSKPLPKRRNIVISSNPASLHPDVEMVASVEEALARVQNEEEVFVLGGARVYQQMLPLCQRMYLTHVHRAYTADAYFPVFSSNEWRETERTDINDDPQAGVAYSFCIYERT